MSKLWRSTRNAQGESLLHEVDLAAQPISTPTIVYISGYKTVDTIQPYIAGHINFVQSILQNQPGLSVMPQVYCWSHDNSRKELFNIAAYGTCPRHLYCSPAEQLAKQTVLPLVCKDGKPLPYAEAQKNLRNLTFLGYSAGSVVAQEVFNVSLKMMEEAGYKKEDASKLLKEVVLISVGTISRPPREQNRFTTIALLNSDDLFVKLKNVLLHPLQNSFFKAARPLTIKALSDTTLFISAAGSRRIWDRREKTKEKNVGDVELPRWRRSTSNHTLGSYVNFDDKHSQFSRIVPYALINALNRKTTISPYQLLEPPAAVPAAEKALYQRKIDEARTRVSAPKAKRA